ncbi:hypothetical protein Trichorick_01577 (plasmid) [Candidatus Trichorickettsia mobilis]|jgi:hypothetical protein|uniref:hypothetical protein n=1 Tax=Candidatus Trichorickettsia mobilis TaxID=1346319 RepID=UPI002B260EB5|nr:hypothetical protein [Candidatus Trichorickettsia mobilis]WPY01659.1 hypothetical protein Trichorick_01577 [Candidatus Trichorickettsia mobilis]
MKEQSYSGFKLACQRNNVVMITKFLKSSTKEVGVIDVLHENGLFFNIAISHNNTPLLKILLDYMYNTEQVELDPKNNNTEQSIRYHQLQQIFKSAKKEYVVSEEVDSLISSFCKESNFDSNDSYIDYGNLSTHDQEYPELDLAGNSKLLEDNEF